MTTVFRLADLLKQRGVSQSELARTAGVGLSTISRLCRNATSQVSLATLDKLAVALNCTPGDLIVREKAKRRTA